MPLPSHPLATTALFVLTAVMEIVGCYLPYLWLRGKAGAWVLLPAALALAHKLTADSAPVSIAATRHMLWRMAGAPHPNVAHRWDSRMIFARGRMGDAKEGVVSFLEKRPAQFSDSVARDYPVFEPFDVDPGYE